jgi:hypothetical protein
LSGATALVAVFTVSNSLMTENGGAFTGGGGKTVGSALGIATEAKRGTATLVK